MAIYEVSLTIRKDNSDSKISYYERWLSNPIRHEPYFQPIFEQVFVRDVSIAPEPQDQWYVLIYAKGNGKQFEKTSFTKGRQLIREFVNDENLHIKD
jgi:hypothetical protein